MAERPADEALATEMMYLCAWCGEEVSAVNAWNANGWPCCSEQCMEAALAAGIGEDEDNG